MTEKNIKSDTEDDVDDEAEQNLKTRLKAYLFAAYATVDGRDIAVGRGDRAIAPRGLSLPQVSGRALKSLVLAGLLIGAAVAMPAAPFGDDPTGPQTGAGRRRDVRAGRRRRTSLNGVSLNTLPSTYLSSGAEAPDPPKERCEHPRKPDDGGRDRGGRRRACDRARRRAHPRRSVGVDRDRVNEHVGEVPDGRVRRPRVGEQVCRAAAGARRTGGVLRPRVLDEHRHVRRRGDAVRRRGWRRN